MNLELMTKIDWMPFLSNCLAIDFQTHVANLYGK
ncbi:hypothetical protein J514_4298, partial [Acinetobacter sp. 1396970]